MHFAAQRRLIDHSGCFLVMEQLGGIKGPPHPISAQELVDDQRVGVELRVPRPARPMLEQRRGESGGRDLLGPVSPTARHRRVGVEVRQPGRNCGLVRRHCLSGGLGRTQGPQGTDALRGAERQVEACHAIGAPRPPEPFTGPRVQPAGQQRLELLLPHPRPRRQPQGLQATAVPPPRRLPLSQVVLRDPTGHRVGVVPPRARPDLRRTQHPPHPRPSPSRQGNHRTFGECTCLPPGKPLTITHRDWSGGLG